MIPLPRWREFVTAPVAAIYGWLTERAWRDRPPRIRTRLFTTADRAAAWLERRGRYQAAQVIWRHLGVW